MEDKRGISEIIVTLVIVLLSLVAVGIVWAVVSNILSGSTSQTSSTFGQLSLSMNIQSVKTNADGSVAVAVKRNAGTGSLSGINFIVSDGTNSQTIKKDAGGLQELGVQNFIISPSDLTAVGFVKDVQIAPVTKDSSGKEIPGNVVDDKKIATTIKQNLQNFGAISWYKFEADAKDEFGSNNGVSQGPTFVSGKFGNSANFDGTNDYIDISTNPAQLKNDSFTISFWLKKSNTRYENILSYSQLGSSGTINVNLNSNMLRFESFTNNNYQPASISTGITVSDGNWHNFVIVSTPTEFALYTDGNKSYSTTPNTDSVNQIFRYIGYQQLQSGYGNWLTGQMDELIIFNQSLNAGQIRNIYNTDLSKN